MWECDATGTAAEHAAEMTAALQARDRQIMATNPPHPAE